MKITDVWQPHRGKRGGLAMMGSITLQNDNGEVIWIRVDSPRGWSDGQQKMFDDVASTLTARYGDIVPRRTL